MNVLIILFSDLHLNTFVQSDGGINMFTPMSAKFCRKVLFSFSRSWRESRGYQEVFIFLSYFLILQRGFFFVTRKRKKRDSYRYHTNLLWIRGPEKGRLGLMKLFSWTQGNPHQCFPRRRRQVTACLNQGRASPRRYRCHLQPPPSK